MIGGGTGAIGEMAAMGQDVSRAARAGMSKEQRQIHALRVQQAAHGLENSKLRNQYLELQIQREAMNIKRDQQPTPMVEEVSQKPIKHTRGLERANRLLGCSSKLGWLI